MRVLYLNENQVRELLPMAEAIRLVGEAFDELGRGQAQSHPRRRLILSTGSVLHSMAGAYGKYFGTKIYSTNPRYGAYFHFLLYDAATAKPLALMEANWLGQIRTGAASGLATDRLARADAKVLGMIGSGFQARSQMDAILAVRELEEIRVWSRSKEKCEFFVTEARDVPGIRIAGSAEECVRGADIVVTMTSAKDPVFESDWVSDGTHVNGAGTNIANRRELPAELLARASCIVVDSKEQAKIEAGDLILGLTPDQWDRVAELKDGRKRQSDSEITIFKSVGIGLEDVAVGGFVYERAISKGIACAGLGGVLP